MKKMPEGTFKAHCLAVMDEVQAKKETVLITKHGRWSSSFPQTKRDDIYGFLGKIAITGNIIAPALSLKEWGNLK